MAWRYKDLWHQQVFVTCSAPCAWRVNGLNIRSNVWALSGVSYNAYRCLNLRDFKIWTFYKILLSICQWDIFMKNFSKLLAENPHQIFWLYIYRCIFSTLVRGQILRGALKLRSLQGFLELFPALMVVSWLAEYEKYRSNRCLWYNTFYFISCAMFSNDFILHYVAISHVCIILHMVSSTLYMLNFSEGT